MGMRRFLLFVGALICSLALSSCLKSYGTRDVYPKVRTLYAGTQGDNGFQLWIWIYEEDTWPARVLSGFCRYVDGYMEDTDEELLTYKATDNGFTLCNRSTGEVLYTATYIQKNLYDQESKYYISISWTHSPGQAWDEYAEENGWEREMELCVQPLGEG